MEHRLAKEQAQEKKRTNSKVQKEKGITSQSASEESSQSAGEGELNKVSYGEVPPPPPPTGGLTPYNFYTIVDRKGTPSVYLTLTNRTPFTYLV